MTKRFLGYLTILLFIGIIGYILLQTKKVSFIYSDFGVAIPADYSILGIDISHHQGKINYAEVMEMNREGDSIQFVYIKATEGKTHKDRSYDDNAEGFATYKVKYGFYHYFQPDVSAREQAVFFTAVIDGYNFKLLPVVDVEITGNQSREALVDSVKVFLDCLETELNCRPMIYTFISFYEDYFKGTELDRELYWIASYSRRNKYLGKDNMLLWQFTESATVDGIGTNVDMNVAIKGFNEKVVLEKFR